MTYFLRLLRSDIDRFVDTRRGTAHQIGRTFLNPGLQAVVVYRFGRLLNSHKHRVWLWPVLIFAIPLQACAAFMIRSCYGIYLGTTADIGPAFWVGHFGGVEVTNCRLGSGCSVGQQTKIGTQSNSPGPQIGDGVWIGAHAKILGPVLVGDGATIAPGARVIKDVPNDALVMGDPARVVLRHYDNTAILPKGSRVIGMG
jgi:serine O-acetyltransferase